MTIEAKLMGKNRRSSKQTSMALFLGRQSSTYQMAMPEILIIISGWNVYKFSGGATASSTQKQTQLEGEWHWLSPRRGHTEGKTRAHSVVGLKSHRKKI